MKSILTNPNDLSQQEQRIIAYYRATDDRGRESITSHTKGQFERAIEFAPNIEQAIRIAKRGPSW